LCSAGDAVQGCGEGAAASLSALAPEGAIEARYSHSGSLPGVLEQAKCSLLVSARQADQPVSVGTHEGQAIFSFNGIGQAVVWQSTDPKWCLVPKRTTVTGDIQCHEVAWGRDAQGAPDLWLVNTLFSCLVGLDPAYSFMPRWYEGQLYVLNSGFGRLERVDLATGDTRSPPSNSNRVWKRSSTSKSCQTHGAWHWVVGQTATTRSGCFPRPKVDQAASHPRFDRLCARAVLFLLVPDLTQAVSRVQMCWARVARAPKTISVEVPDSIPPRQGAVAS